MLVKKMKQFGYTESETNIYLSLVENGSMTGYEVSKKSGVPRSKVYNNLETLVKKGVVLVNKSEPKIYSAISPEEFVSMLKQTTLGDIQYLDDHLSDIKEKEDDTLLWQLENKEAVQHKILYMIEHAKESLYIQIWEESLSPTIIQALKEAEARLEGFVCILFSPSGHYTLPFKRFYPHGFETDKLEDMGGRWVNLICDDDIVLFGTLDDTCDVIWSHNKAMRLLAKEYVKHDAYTLKIIQEHGQELARAYGNDFEGIRKIF
ncbi:TrmB family transcriptional regulator [Streptococcus parauberis]|uniref:Helix-turn-helix domain-containing protein n=1 Tax=Streptococcus parauberis TaxID=1348 RepID=A0AAE4HXV2_9STRE|nr:TrmB family transcriptional regulator [Streptococcus parauberis]AEF25192.1 transcriptional regulator protein [Streptococcus parauberis KCTC 11537]MDT2732782.1 helix-turn-helix domain-containing protein [Streptococcus parauberis]ONH63370.1 Sugar-specific transcriptional regulator TrmB [Streptococcus parauberis]PCH11703.1 Sugar-specific transcriptional regulator TrmB [Streptococcus parauberis]UWM91745.1 TrmB family transcriptional regulator [Streptococcus parauberis]